MIYIYGRFLKTIVVVIYGHLVKVNETLLKGNMKINKEVVPVAVNKLVWMKLKKIYEENKNENIIILGEVRGQLM